MGKDNGQNVATESKPDAKPGITLPSLDGWFSLGENAAGYMTPEGLLFSCVNTNKRLRLATSGKSTLISTSGAKKVVALPTGEQMHGTQTWYIPVAKPEAVANIAD